MPAQARGGVVRKSRFNEVQISAVLQEAEAGITSRGKQCRAQSSSVQNRRRSGCGIPGGGPQDLTLLRRIGISSHRGATPGCGDCRTDRDRAADEHVSVGLGSRSLLSYVMQERLSFFAGEKLEKPQGRLQENLEEFHSPDSLPPRSPRRSSPDSTLEICRIPASEPPFRSPARPPAAGSCTA